MINMKIIKEDKYEEESDKDNTLVLSVKEINMKMINTKKINMIKLIRIA